MKKLMIILVLMAFISIKSYSQNANVTALLNAPETRTEIFNAIVENKELMTEFMKNLRNNQQAMSMMAKDGMMSNEGKMDMKQDHKMMKNDCGMMKKAEDKKPASKGCGMQKAEGKDDEHQHNDCQ